MTGDDGAINPPKLLYQDILGDDNDDAPTKTKFKILNGTEIPFDYEVQKDGVCITEADVSFLEGMGVIEVLERDIPGNKGLFSGAPEPIMSEGLRYVYPATGMRNLEGEDLRIAPFGEWKCSRCEQITYVPLNGTKITEPYECDNDLCGRKNCLKPMFPIELIRPIWKLPSGDPIPSTFLEVYSDIYNFVKKYLVLKDDEYHILTLWIMTSWLVDDFQTCPYLCMIAPKSSGKTQVLNVLGELAYRAVSAISVTAAALFRSIELWHITLLIDEAEYQVREETESGQALYGCLNGGYKRGSYAIRIEGDSSTSRVPTTYDVFGFKAIASTKLFNPTLESRSIIFNMSQGKPEKILIDTQVAGILRRKLLFWRFSTLGKLPLVFPESNSGRLIEMFIPLYTVAQQFKNKSGIILPITYEKIQKILDDKLGDMENVRQEEELESTEAKIIQVIFDLMDKAKKSEYDEVGKIKVIDIARELKWIDEYTESKAATKVFCDLGRKLKVMGVRTKHTMHGSIIQYSETDVETTLKELEKRYLNTKT